MNNKKILLVVIGVFLIIGVCIGLSYAYYLATISQEGENVVRTDCFALEYVDNGQIVLDNTYPIKDSDIDDLVPYHFKIKNVCNLPASYQVNLEILNDSDLSIDYLNYTFNDGTITPLNTASLESTTPTLTNASSAKIMATGNLIAGEEKEYDLKIWVKESVTTADPVQNKTFKSKIVVISTLNKSIMKNIRLHANGGTIPTDKFQGYVGYKFVNLPTPTKEGQEKFMGWYSEAEFTNLVTNDTIVTSEMTDLYAKWENPYAVNVIRDIVLGEDNITTNVIDKGNGNTLAYDGTTDNNLRYVGANPNNYVKFNNELWRIIGVMNNIRTQSGQTQSLLKIVRNDSLGSYSWDSSILSLNEGEGVNQWGESGSYEGADLMRELNTDYLGNITVGTDDKWFSSYENEKSYKPSSIINSSSQSMIESVNWNLGTDSCTGKYSCSGTWTPKNFYQYERSNTPAYNGKSGCNAVECNDNVNRTTSWTGKIALIYPSDYGFATAGGTNKDRNSCLDTSMYVWSDPNQSYARDTNSGDCMNNNWITGDKFTLTPSNSRETWVFEVSYKGWMQDRRGAISSNIYPSLYLKSSVLITSGLGTASDPYILSI